MAIVLAGLLVEWPADQSTEARMDAVRAPRSIAAHWLEAVASAGLGGTAAAIYARLRGDRAGRPAFAALATYGFVLVPLAVLLAAVAPRLADAGDVAAFSRLMRGVESAYALATLLFLVAVALLARGQAVSATGVTRSLAFAVIGVAAVAAIGVVAAAVGFESLAPLGFLALVTFLWLGGSGIARALARR